MKTNRIAERNGITLIEVLIVVVIIGILLTLTLPAVESARERARMATCANNLRQIGTAFQLHYAAHNSLPTNGWGYMWVGDPDRGFSRGQPGGWIYNILPYIEQADVRQIPAGLPAGSPEKKTATARMLRAVVNGLNCPDRRLGGILPCNDPFEPYNSDAVTETMRSDFAANGGDVYCDPAPGMTKGPSSIQDADSHKWNGEFARLTRECNGIVYPASLIGFKDITDGTTYTYLAGEKHMKPEHYRDGRGAGDERSIHVGANREINRWADHRPKRDGIGSNHGIWGSAHQNGFNMAFCDGSVRMVSYEIDSVSHKSLANRRDGKTVDMSAVQ